MRLSLEHVELSPLVNELRQMVAPLAAEKKVNLVFDIQPGINGLEADPSRLRQILINLINNAIKFNKENGTVTVRVFKTEEQQWAVCEVQDTGIGIPKEKLSKVFSEFYRVESVSKQYEGTGLGLAVTKKLVELHGGSISVESEEGVGSTFIFRLPVTPLSYSGKRSRERTTLHPLNLAV